MSENVRRLRPELWQQKNWLLHHDSSPSQTHFLARESLTENSMTVVPHPSYSSLFPRLKVKVKCRHFYANEVIEPESEAVLNSLS
jgi:hypothetical protein